MKTDALFYQLFQTLPDLFFELSGLPYSESYQFQSVELKQIAFRIDGVFIPKELELPLIFVEIQFQKDKRFYARLVSEIMLYLYQQQPKQTLWQAVVIFPSRAVDNGNLNPYELLLPRLQRIYLDEILPQQPSSALNLLAMIIANEDKAIKIAKDLLQQPFNQSEDQAFLLNAVETILFYKLPKLSREEIRNMINMAHVDITHTSWYQAGRQEGKKEGIQEGKKEGRREGMQQGMQQGEKTLIFRLLSKRFGQLNPPICQKIDCLSMTDLEQLADDFLNFATIEDLKLWLRHKLD